MTNPVEDKVMGIPDIHEAFNAVKEVNKYWKVRWGFLQHTAGKNEKEKALQLPRKTRWQGKLLTYISSLDNEK